MAKPIEAKKPEDKEEERDWECDGLMHSIRQVELAKAEKPEMYSKALSKLKGEAKTISSIADLKERAQELGNKDNDSDEE